MKFKKYIAVVKLEADEDCLGFDTTPESVHGEILSWLEDLGFVVSVDVAEVVDEG